ncbi:glycosyltransferase [Paenibacillus assamensis]|uniref:glycosyltransferase n=1 Tax=Paenibacillus assamensis TaxID=311244 RepID=UPI00040F1DF0|nr:glycosyltransferase [Paenibacillus assamensis]
MNEKVAVIIPCYNYGAYIEETVESVLTATYHNYEIIIVDDGSTDQHTIEVLRELQQHNRVTVVRQLNGGLSSARNTGILATDADYILTLDADDLIDPTFIEKGVWLLNKYPDYAFVYPLVQLFGEVNYVWNTLPYNYDYLKVKNFIPATIIMRRTAWETVGGYDNSMREGFEDWEFVIRLGKHNLIGLHIDEILFYYRKHKGSMLEGSNKKRAKLMGVIKSKHKDIYSIWKLLRSIFVFIIVELRWRSQQKLASLQKRLLSFIPVEYKEKLKKFLINMKNNRTYESTLQAPIESKLEQGSAGTNNVMVILPWLEVGGVETVFLNLISALKMEYNFFIVTTAGSEHQPMKREFANHVKSIHDISSFVNNEQDKLEFIAYLIEKNDISIVHISNSQLGYRAAKYIKATCPDVKIVDTLHMEEPWAAWDYFNYSKSYSEFLDRRVVLTQSQKQRLVSENKHQIVDVIPNGIQVSSLCVSKSSDDPFIIGFIGRMVAQKHPLLFIRVAKEISLRKLPIQFIIVGSGPLEKLVKKEITKQGLQHLIRYEEATRDVKSIFNRIHALCAPSLREGFPMIGLEAMEACVPIVATDVPGWNDLIEHGTNGLLAESESNLLAEQCITLYENHILRNRIIDKARSCVEDIYSIKRMIEEYKKVYEIASN